MSSLMRDSKIVACLDIGSSKIVCFIASISGDEINIIGYSHYKSKGINGGIITDMKIAQSNILSTVSKAERMAGVNIDKVLVGISGSQTLSYYKDLQINVLGDVIKSSDIANLANRARFDAKQQNQEVIHLIPLQYRIDNSTPVVNPRYMSGDKLYAKLHIISTSHTSIKNIESCLKACQLSVNNYIVTPYASMLSCVGENELNFGCLVIDIGNNSSSYCIAFEGNLIHVGSVKIGGSHITKDISTILNISFDLAEKIKNINNSLVISPIEENEIIKLKDTSLEDNENVIGISRLELKQIISARLEEIFEKIKINIEKSGFPLHIMNSVIITGGVSAIFGVDRLASNIFNKSVRIGYLNRNAHKITCKNYEIFSPTYSCALGMLIFLKNWVNKENSKGNEELKKGFFRKIFNKLFTL